MASDRITWAQTQDFSVDFEAADELAARARVTAVQSPWLLRVGYGISACRPWTMSSRLVTNRSTKPMITAAIAILRIVRQKAATITAAMMMMTRVEFRPCGAEASASMFAPGAND